MTPLIMRQGRLAPWLYLLPALFIMLIFIVYPTLNTIYLSFLDASSSQSAATNCVPGDSCWGAFENYHYALTNPDMVTALRNNALWLLVMVPGTVIGGLVFAVLADRVRYESLAKSIIFMPMAISFIGAGIIWRFVYYIETGSGEQIGLLNAVLVALGAPPQAFLSNPAINNFALMLVGVWLWAGFCMTILSAAIKGLSAEVLEAARVDGASEWQLFFRIMLPLILPTVTVVITTMVINVLKIFDIVFVMTGGNYGTEVIANRMFKLIVTDTGRSMAIAVILIILTIPIMIINIRRFRQQEAIR
ncbi:MAG: sugar ABC transporter permease [Anaerolineales bacterium]|nr:sugar ABC transporter permease [Anaerolineales bacterium]